MKSLYMRLSAYFLVFFLSCTSVNAQQFKWVKGGGTTYTFSISNDWEQVKYMCTDPNGNFYAVSQVGNNPIYADTFYRSGAYGSDCNLLLTSYNCNGQMRWAKLIASSSGEDFAYGLIADSVGHIYLAGLLETGTLHIGDDTTIGAFDMITGIIQLDTLGHFKWIRYVGNNSLSTLFGTHGLGSTLAMDGSNNVHFLNYMLSGVHITPSVTSTTGVYDLVYSPTGTLLSQTRLDLDTEWFLHGAVIDPVTNKLYVCGEISDQLIGIGYTDTFYAAAFDASRSRLWMYFAGHGDDDGLTGIVMDRHRNLLFSGAAQGGMSGPIRFVFNGDSTIAGAPGDIAVIMKTDTNGTVKWITRFDSYFSVNTFRGITLLANDKVAAAGIYGGTIKNGGDSAVSVGQDADVVIVDSSGDVQVVQGIRGDGFYDGGNAITSDKVGNIYVGGEVADSIIEGGGIPAYHTVGGNTDFFIVKYGVDCSCTSMPISAYTDTGTHTVGVTYTGTTSGIDSVVWDFGDGSATVTGLTALHTYTMAGTFRVCATVYTSCGNDIYCSNVVINIPSLGISVIPSMLNVKVYPNPTNDELNVTGVQESTGYRLLSVTGTCASQGFLRQGSNIIPMKNTAAGVYVLEMTGMDGDRNIVRVVKE